MPITSVGSWLPTIDEILAHWQAVNDDLTGGGGAELTLIGGYDRADLVTDRAAVDQAVGNVQTIDNTLQTARGTRDVLRVGIRERGLQFGPAVRGNLPNTRYLPAIPTVPVFQASAGVYRDYIDDMTSLWTQINANTPAVAARVDGSKKLPLESTRRTGKSCKASATSDDSKADRASQDVSCAVRSRSGHAPRSV